LNEFLRAVSFALDFVEIDILGVSSNHGKRTAYTSLNIAKEMGLSREELHDIAAIAILHDNGVCEKSLHDRFLALEKANFTSVDCVREHCIIGKENIKEYPFLTDVNNVLKYHHERFDENGLFNLKGNEVPLMSQITYLSDVVEVNFGLENNNCGVKEKMINFIQRQKDIMVSPAVVEAFVMADYYEMS
jgi:response regulator RpfG family c-di-GMP phosphodiesterase